MMVINKGFNGKSKFLNPSVMQLVTKTENSLLPLYHFAGKCPVMCEESKEHLRNSYLHSVATILGTPIQSNAVQYNSPAITSIFSMTLSEVCKFNYMLL